MGATLITCSQSSAPWAPGARHVDGLIGPSLVLLLTFTAMLCSRVARPPWTVIVLLIVKGDYMKQEVVTLGHIVKLPMQV